MDHSVTRLRADKFMLPVLELHSAETARVVAEVDEKVRQSPEFFRNAPLVIDLKRLAPDQDVEFRRLLESLRSLRLNPVAVRGGGARHTESARAVELAVLSEERAEGRDERGAEPRAGGPKPANVIHTRPVRSGQKLAAPGGDLTVIASTGAGSELIASGNIHVYGTLRGRAIAGAGGDESSRVFCRRLDAELVSVAGAYLVSEEIDDRFRGNAAQVFLDAGELKVSLLNGAS